MPENTTHAAIVGDPENAALGGRKPEGLQTKDLVNRVAERAHEAVDRMAEKAGPAAQKLESGMAHANESIAEQTQRMRELGDEWTHSVRDSVRENPLTALLLAVTAGVVIARITR